MSKGQEHGEGIENEEIGEKREKGRRGEEERGRQRREKRLAGGVRWNPW